MTDLSGMESEDGLSEVPTTTNRLGVYSQYLRRSPSISGRGLP